MVENVIQCEKYKSLDNNINLFYRNTHEVNEFFKNCPENKFILVSSDSDGKVTDNPTRFDVGSSNDADIKYIPNNLLHWYGQNICVKHDKITSIPIGLENDYWFPDFRKRERIFEKLLESKSYKNLVYFSANVNTHPDRQYLYNIMNKPFCTLEHGTNGNKYHFENYLDNVYNHKFVLCPEGNGTDTHRTWETLYLGSIPIEKRNINNSFYEGLLPICFVNNWDDITEDFLNNEYVRINQNVINDIYNKKMLNINYWYDLIRSKLNV